MLAGAFNRKSKWMLQERLVAVCVLTVIKSVIVMFYMYYEITAIFV